MGRRNAENPKDEMFNLPMTRDLHEVAEAIIAAATEIGEDLRGKHGLQGYLRRLAVRHPPLFARLLSAAALPPEGKRAAAIEPQGPGFILQGGMTMHDLVAAFGDRGPDTKD